AMMQRSSALGSAMCCAIFFGLLANVAHRSAAADKESSDKKAALGPAYVSVKVALARSGPGLEHYATDALAAGDLVEVVDHQDGWAAIRPPVDAYSWISANKLRKRSSEFIGNAEVISDNVKAWLGSDVAEVDQHISQVQLRRGEIVEVIG